MFLTSSFLPIPSHDGHPTTTASADFSQFVVTTANETVRETSRDKPASLSSSTCLIYIHGLRLPFGLCCPKSAHPPCTPCIRFLSVILRNVRRQAHPSKKAPALSGAFLSIFYYHDITSYPSLVTSTIISHCADGFSSSV